FIFRGPLGGVPNLSGASTAAFGSTSSLILIFALGCTSAIVGPTSVIIFGDSRPALFSFCLMPLLEVLDERQLSSLLSSSNLLAFPESFPAFDLVISEEWILAADL